jgi:hypothetical protein
METCLAIGLGDPAYPTKFVETPFKTLFASGFIGNHLVLVFTA